MTTSEIVEKILAGESVRETIKEFLPVNEGFPIGSYIKFVSGVDGYFTKDQKDDVVLVFEMPMDGLVGRLNTTTTFKLIGYNGDTAKIVAMTDDKKNGNKFGEIYFVARSELESKAKTVLPRKNKYMGVKYEN